MEQWQCTACGEISNRPEGWGAPSPGGCPSTPTGNHIWVRIA